MGFSLTNPIPLSLHPFFKSASDCRTLLSIAVEYPLSSLAFFVWLCVCVRACVSCSVISPIDGKSMESVNSVKMFQKSEYKSNGKVIRWTEVRTSNFAPLVLTLVYHLSLYCIP